jgi:hypothetical protein
VVNQAAVAVLQSTPVPPDLQCVLPQATADAIASTITVVGLASQVQGAAGVTPVTNNTGQQALTLAQANEQAIKVLQGKTLQRRILALRQNVVAGDSIQVYQISPEMPTSDYEVRVSFYGNTTHPSAYYGWRVVNGTQTVSQVSVSFDNAPADSVVTVVVEEARQIL